MTSAAHHCLFALEVELLQGQASEDDEHQDPSQLDKHAVAQPGLLEAQAVLCAAICKGSMQ